MQLKYDGDRRLNLDRLTIQHGRAIAPLAHGVERGLHQERMAAQHHERSDSSVAADDGLEAHGAVSARFQRQRRVAGLDPPWTLLNAGSPGCEAAALDAVRNEKIEERSLAKLDTGLTAVFPALARAPACPPRDWQ